MFSFFDAEKSSQLGSPQSAMDIVITSLIFAFFGVMWFVAAIRYELSYDKKAKWWKGCFALLGIAALLGLQRMAFLTNFAYANTVITRKLLYAHYLSFLIPVLCIASIILYNWLKVRNEGRRVY